MNHFLKPILLITLLGVSVVHSNDDALITERSRLINAINELTLLQQYIENTSNVIKHDSKTRFNYRALEEDIDILKSGIQRYLNHESTKPNQPRRVIKAISGEYAT